MCPWVAVSAVLFLILPVAAAGQSGSALSVYRNGNYKAAVPLLEAALVKSPADPVLHAALLSALVYEGKVDQASGAAETDAKQFPNSPDVTAARGEFAYYMGDMADAAGLFRAALKMNPNTARAGYGLSRLYHAASMYRTARMLSLQSHQADPNDALITRLWMTYLVGERRKELLPPFMAAHPWFYKDAARYQATHADIGQGLHGRKAFELAAEPRETVLKLFPILRDATHVEGVGLDFTIGGRRPLRLLFDTGANGILLSQKAIDKAGLSHLGSIEAWGIGDAGKRTAFAAIADTCGIDGLKFKACVVRATEGKRHIPGDSDGLIGADVFSDYLQEIDFQRRKLRLIPLPPRPADPQGYDRVIAADEKDFTAILRFGDHLFLPTRLNGKITGLFLIDTGSQTSLVDSTFARLSSKLHGSRMRVAGLSGEVKDVFEADRAVLQFARFSQSNLGLIAVNLNNQPDHQEVRMAGILGLPVLGLFRLTLDYRNGLVKLDYIYAPHKKK